MPTAMNINSRPSIHNEESHDVLSESPTITEIGDSPIQLDDTEEQVYTESGSDFEDYERNRSFSPNDLRRERFEMSRSVPRTPQRPRLPKHRSTTPYERESFTTESSKAVKYSNASDSSSPLLIFVLASIVAIVSIGGFVYANKSGEITCTFEKLKKQYDQQDDKVWLTLRVGIESILNKRVSEPAVYLFVHHGGHHIPEMVKDIASYSSTCFDKEMLPVEMLNSDFTSSEAKQDYGYAIQKYKMKIKQGNVILIANLNEIPAEAARAFHTICDTHSPIAKDVVIFLTLIIPSSVEGNVEKITEDTLIDLWGSKLERNELDPLITRVTDQVINLRS